MKKSFGFTLIELMIVIAIIGILAAIAYPSYQGAIISSNRTNAMGDLIGLQSAMERHYTINNTYEGAGTTAGGNTGSPTIYSNVSPSDGGTTVYDLTIVSAVDASFALLAEPRTGTIQATDGDLTLNSTDVRSWDRNNNGSIDAGENNWN